MFDALDTAIKTVDDTRTELLFGEHFPDDQFPDEETKWKFLEVLNRLEGAVIALRVVRTAFLNSQRRG